MSTEAGGQNTDRPINVVVTGQVTPRVVKVGEPIPLTVTVSNGLGATVYHTNSALEANEWNGETRNISLVDIYRDGKEFNLHLARPEINVPYLVAGIGRTGVEPGKSLQIETDARKWKLRDGWLPGRYEVTVRVDGLEIDPYYRLSVLSDPFEFEIGDGTAPAVPEPSEQDGKPGYQAAVLRSTSEGMRREVKDDSITFYFAPSQWWTLAFDNDEKALAAEITGRKITRKEVMSASGSPEAEAPPTEPTTQHEPAAEAVPRPPITSRPAAPSGPPVGDSVLIPINTQTTLAEVVGKGFTEWEYRTGLLPEKFPGLEYVSGPNDPGLGAKGAWRKPVSFKHGPSGAEVLVNCYRRRVKLTHAPDPNLPGTPFVPLEEPDYRYESTEFHDLKAAAAREKPRDVFVFLDGDVLFKVEAFGGGPEVRQELVRSVAEAIWQFRHGEDAVVVEGDRVLSIPGQRLHPDSLRTADDQDVAYAKTLDRAIIRETTAYARRVSPDGDYTVSAARRVGDFILFDLSDVNVADGNIHLVYSIAERRIIGRFSWYYQG
jgi:hypothetical protein